MAAISFDAGAIDARLTVDRSEFTASLAAARAEAAKGVTVPVSFNVTQASIARAVTAAKAGFRASSAAMPVTFNVSGAKKAAAEAKAIFKASPVSVPVTFTVSKASIVSLAALAATASKITLPAMGGGTAAGAAATVAAAAAIRQAFGAEAAAADALAVAQAAAAKASAAATIAMQDELSWSTSLSASVADRVAKIEAATAAEKALAAATVSDAAGLSYMQATLAATTGKFAAAGGTIRNATGSVVAAAAANDALGASLTRGMTSVSRFTDSQRTLGGAMALLGTGVLAEITGQTRMGRAIDDTTASVGRSYGAFGRYWRVLQKPVTLFGGALGKTPMLGEVAMWHVLTDAAVEFLAVMVPVAVAVTAFGMAAAPSIAKIVTQMKDLNTISEATGQHLTLSAAAIGNVGKAVAATGTSIAPLSGNFANLAKSVQPQVYQLFGDALVIAQGKGDSFSVMAKGAGSALDYLGARMAAAITYSPRLGIFAHDAVSDLQKVGEGVGDLGGIFGTLLAVMPGYAEKLLDVGTAFLNVLEPVTASAAGILRWGLAMHGAIIWGGLAVTAVFLLQDALGSGLVKAVLKASAGLFAYGVEVAGLAAEEGLAAAATLVLSDAMLLLDANPIVWVAAAAAGLAILAVALLSARSATQKWVASMQAAIAAAPVMDAMTTMTRDQTAVSASLTTATQKLADTQEYLTTTNLHTGASVKTVNAAYDTAQAKVAQLGSAYVQVSDQASLFSYRVDALGKSYGGNTAALGALNAAGVTTKQMLTDNTATWQIIKTQVAATTDGYNAMGVASGALGNDMQIVGDQAKSSYTAMQTLNTALSTFISNVTGTQTSFDTVALGGVTLAANFKTAGGAALTTSHTLDGLKVTSTTAGAAMDGMSQASLTLNQAFATQVGNINTLAASYRTAGIAANLQKQGIADSIAPMEQYAAGSQEATAQLVALAEEAGYNGPVSLTALNKYLGITSTSTGALAADQKNLKAITNQATLQEALLTGAMQGQGNYITTSLLNDLSAAEIKYGGVATATAAWGKAIAQDGIDSSQAQGARTALINDMIATGVHAGQSAAQIAALITKITGIPVKTALQIVMDGEGKYTIGPQPTPTGAAPKLGTTGNPIGEAATGMLVRGGIPGRDSVLVNTMPGELIVPTSLVNRGAVDHLRGRIPGFASGGLVPGVTATGNANVLTGQQAVTDYTSFKTSIQTALVTAMVAAMKAAANIAGGAGTKGSMTAPEVEALWVSVGGPVSASANMARIAYAESGDVPGIVQQGQPFGLTGMGLWQITPTSGIVQNGRFGNLLNASNNARAALSLYNASGYGPWTSDPVGAYLVGGGGQRTAGYATGTPGAAPGWGVVGEQGPELVRFHGGEPIVPHGAAKALGALPGYATGTPLSGAALAKDIVAYAASLEGHPYVLGGNGPESFDCSGFSRYVYAHYGVNGGMPRTSEEQFGWVQRTGLPTAGGLVFMAGADGTQASPGHVGIIKSSDRMIDAYDTATGVTENAIKGSGGAISGYGVPPGGQLAVTTAAAAAITAAAKTAQETALAAAGRKLMSGVQRHPETLVREIAAATQTEAESKILLGVKGLGAKERAKLTAAEKKATGQRAYWTAESAELTAYRTELANSNASLRSEITAAGHFGLGAVDKRLTAQLAEQVGVVRKINDWLGPSAAQTAAAATAAAAAASAASTAAAATAAAGPSGSDLITAWLTAQGWAVGGTQGTTSAPPPMQWFDSGGRLPTGFSISGNATGGSERVLSHGEEDALSRHLGGGGSKVETLLGQMVKLLTDAPAKTAAGVGGALNGTARGAARRGQYSTR